MQVPQGQGSLRLEERSGTGCHRRAEQSVFTLFSQVNGRVHHRYKRLFRLRNRRRVAYRSRAVNGAVRRSDHRTAARFNGADNVAIGCPSFQAPDHLRAVPVPLLCQVRNRCFHSTTRLREQLRQGLFIGERSFAIVHIRDLAGTHIFKGTSIVTTTALQREQA